MKKKQVNVKSIFHFFFWVDHDLWVFFPWWLLFGNWYKEGLGPMFVLAIKHTETKVALKRFNRLHFSALSSRVSLARDQLVRSQMLLSCDKGNKVFQIVERIRYAHLCILSCRRCSSFFKDPAFNEVLWSEHTFFLGW